MRKLVKFLNMKGVRVGLFKTMIIPILLFAAMTISITVEVSLLINEIENENKTDLLDYEMFL
jgi:hypothetical protein